MSPQKSQLGPNPITDGVELAWWSAGTYQFNKALYVLQGFTEYKVAVMGGAGGRSGVISYSSGGVNLAAGAAGGGGGGFQLKSGKLSDLNPVTEVRVGIAGGAGASKTGYGTANNGTHGGNSWFGSVAKASGGEAGRGGSLVSSGYKVNNGVPGRGGLGGQTGAFASGNGGGYSGNLANGTGNGGRGGSPNRRRIYPGGSDFEPGSRPGYPGSGGDFQAAGAGIVSPFASGGGGGAFVPGTTWGGSWFNTARTGGTTTGLVVILLK